MIGLEVLTKQTLDVPSWKFCSETKASMTETTRATNSLESMPAHPCLLKVLCIDMRRCARSIDKPQTMQQQHPATLQWFYLGPWLHQDCEKQDQQHQVDPSGNLEAGLSANTGRLSPTYLEAPQTNKILTKTTRKKHCLWSTYS